MHDLFQEQSLLISCTAHNTKIINLSILFENIDLFFSTKMGSNLKSPALIAKVATLVLGVVVLGIGLYSHFQSSWVKQIPRILDPSWGFGNVKTFKFCDLRHRDPLYREMACPHISLEYYYVSIVIISFIISILVLIAEFVVDMRSGPLKFIDIGYHGIFAVFLLVAGIVYIVSAVQIDNLFGNNYGTVYPLESAGYRFRKGEKIAAGVLTLIQSVLYGATAGLIAKRSVNGLRRNTKEDFGTNLGH